MRRWRSERLAALHERQQRGDIRHAVGHPGIGRQTVAAGAAGFLVIGLERLGRIEMRDEAHVGLVDAHAEGDGRDHDHALVLEEAILVALAHRRIEPGVIGQRHAAFAAQPGRDFLDAFARQAIDDAGIAAMLGIEEGPELISRVVLGDDAVADVRPVEAGGEDARLAEAQALDDIAARRPVGGRGQGDARHSREALVQHRELEIFRAEIVAPLRDAMRLVDGEERRTRLRQKIEAARRHQPLGRDVDEIEIAGAHRPLDVRRFAGIEARIEIGRAHADLAQRIDLVLHQRDQRRDHDAEARPQQRRDLIAQRLAAAGRHQHQRIAARRHMRDDLGLLAAEFGIAEGLAQQRERRRGYGMVVAIFPGTHARSLPSFAAPRHKARQEYSRPPVFPSSHAPR